ERQPAAAGGGGPLTASVRLPQLRKNGADLGVLPFPFIDGQPDAVRFLLADVSPATLTAAAQASVALGHRATSRPSGFETALLVDPGALAGAANLIVLGSWDAGASPADLARGLPPAPARAAAVAEASAGPRTAPGP